MRHSFATAVGVLLLVAANTARPVDFVTPRSLNFINARGGIEIGQPEKGERGWRLPVSCDLSGISSIQERRNVLHSGLAWWRTAAEVTESHIYLTIETNSMGPRAPSARCGAAELGYIDAGPYEVFYRDPDGTITKLVEVTISR